MTKGPGLFSDFGKKAKDILRKDYSCDQNFRVSTQRDAGVALVSTTVNIGRLSSGVVAAQYKYKNVIVNVTVDTESKISTTLTVRDFLPSTNYIVSDKLLDYDSDKVLVSAAVKKGGLSFGVLTTQYKYKNAVFDIRVDTESKISTSLTVRDIQPSLNAIASHKLRDHNSGKIEVQYFHDHASFTTAVDLKKSPAVDFSSTIGTPSIAFGTETDKGDALKLSYLHHLGKRKRGGLVGEISRKFSTHENRLTVGCSYPADHYTVVKAQLNSHGNVGALIQHELKRKSFMTISGTFNIKAMEKIPKFGLALSLGP